MGQTTEVYRNRFGSLLAGRGKSNRAHLALHRDFFFIWLWVRGRIFVFDFRDWKYLELLDMLKRGRSAALAEGRGRVQHHRNSQNRSFGSGSVCNRRAGNSACGRDWPPQATGLPHKDPISKSLFCGRLRRSFSEGAD